MSAKKKNTSSNPWDLSLEKRLEILDQARKQKKKIALLLYPVADSSTFRYRGYNIFRATQASKKWQLVYFFNGELETVKSLLESIDILIFGRQNAWSFEIDNISSIAKRNHVPVLYDLDDCICGTKHIKTMINTIALNEEDQNYWIKTCANCEMISYAVDGFLTTNSYLGDILSKDHDNKPSFVIQNSLNQEQIDYSSKKYDQKKQQSASDKFTIGYFSGSHTHAADLEVVFEELLDILKNHPDIRFEMVGMMSLPASADPFIKNGQIIKKPFVDYLKLQGYVSEVDLNIAPLTDNVFTNCKSELKFFEASIVGVPTIASPTFTFANSITDGDNGFLCRPGEWTEKILALYKDRDLARKIAEKANTYCLKRYSPEATCKQAEEVFDKVISTLA